MADISAETWQKFNQLTRELWLETMSWDAVDVIKKHKQKEKQDGETTEERED